MIIYDAAEKVKPCAPYLRIEKCSACLAFVTEKLDNLTERGFAYGNPVCNIV